MDTKNVIAAISLSAAVIILYSLFFAPAVVDQKDISNDKNITNENSSTDAPSLVQDEETIKISRNDALKENERVLFENDKIKRRLRNIMNEAMKSININLNYCYLLIARISVSKDPYEIIKNATLEDFKKIKWPILLNF